MFVAAPSSNGGAVALGSLNVSPDFTYGGQQLTFAGDIGSGRQVIRLQRRGNPSAAWADVIDPRTGRAFTVETDADGSFRFTFPAFAMNGAYVRLANRNGVGTTPHLMKTVHQDATLDIVEAGPAHVPLPRGVAVLGEDFFVSVDTVGRASLRKPVLQGRGVTLQLRDGNHDWNPVDTGVVGGNGRLQLGRYGTGLGDKPFAGGVYRVVLEDWTQNGDNVGWFPSLPFYVHLVNRPGPVTGLQPTGATTSSITLEWTLPVDASRDRIVIARSLGPNPRAPRDVVATLAGSAEKFTDTGLSSGQTYHYAIYTVSRYTADGGGVYTRTPTPISAATVQSRSEG